MIIIVLINMYLRLVQIVFSKAQNWSQFFIQYKFIVYLTVQHGDDCEEAVVLNADGVYVVTYSALLLNLKLIRSGYYESDEKSLPMSEVMSFIQYSVRICWIIWAFQSNLINVSAHITISYRGVAQIFLYHCKLKTNPKMLHDKKII